MSLRNSLLRLALLGAAALAGTQAAAQATFTIDASNVVNPVAPDVFGVNLVAPYEATTGTYPARFNAAKATLSRWPGGGVAENRMRMYPTGINNDHFETTLTEFLAFAQANDITPTIVVPTKRYRNDLALATAEIGSFVQRVTSGEFGAVQVPIWEVGNEFYVDQGPGGSGNTPDFGATMTYAEYGATAAHITDVIRTNAAYPVKIAVQGGQNAGSSSALTNNVNTLKSYFDAGDFDLLIMHAYPNNFTKNNKTFMHRNLDNMKTLWGTKWKPYYISEWNVKNCTLPPSANADCNTDLSYHDFGMAQGTTMLDIFSSFVQLGTDAAAAWPLQRENNTGFFDVEGTTGNVPFVGGKIFSWLTEVSGMNMVATTATGTVNSKIQVVSFANANKMIVFVANGLADAQTAELSLNNFPMGSYSARRLFSTDPGDYRLIPSEAGAGVTRAGPYSNVLRVPLTVSGPNEMVKITVNR